MVVVAVVMGMNMVVVMGMIVMVVVPVVVVMDMIVMVVAMGMVMGMCVPFNTCSRHEDSDSPFFASASASSAHSTLYCIG